MKEESNSRSKTWLNRSGSNSQLMIPYGKVFNRNMNDLKTELLHQGVAENDIPETVTARKDILRRLEIDRLIAEGVDQTVAAARKEFKRQSTAAFKLTD